MTVLAGVVVTLSGMVAGLGMLVWLAGAFE